MGEGYQCPALDPASHRCRIYAARPLDCRLYPFVLTRDAANRVLLNVDTKCPYVQQLGPGNALRDYGLYLTSLMESVAGQAALTSNPGLASRPREEYWVVHPVHDPQPSQPADAPAGFVALETAVEDLERALGVSGRPLSAYHPALWLGWRDLIRCWWKRVDGYGYLVAEQANGYFLALPPLGPPLTRRVVEEVFTMLEMLNAGNRVTRIDNVPPEWGEVIERWGYRIVPVEHEYLYRRQALLRHYRRQAEKARRSGARVRRLTAADTEACLRLYTFWALRKQAGHADSQARAMLRDNFYVHRRWLTQATDLGVVGWVVEQDEIEGYFCGVPLGSEVFVVLAQVAHPDREGTGALLMATCLRTLPSPLVNTMGDAGLSFLTRGKMAEGPLAVRPVCSATPS